jgi:hypothetical protein
MYADLIVQRSEFNYLFFLYLIQKESLNNVLTRYKQEDLKANPGSLISWQVVGINQMEEEVAITWNPPNCLRSESSRSLFELEEYPPIPETEDPNLRDEVS